jgi:hypothetical protein
MVARDTSSAPWSASLGPWRSGGAMTHVMAHEMVHVLDLSELLQSASTEEWVVEHPVVAVAARPGYQQKLPLLFSRLR